ncbi:aldo/keto reductase [Streptomyces sp. NRRL F-5755]|uniref:aldo/keto reductase n=1 Tax=Streptomyces sp. NRRL F-5755 TaxID=1519475 RepID=UPI002D21E092|nr:aldo/keto reductase [Streptomyces sp. NRRL F-5755]
MRRACETLLCRLRTDHVDRYYLARIALAVPVEDSAGALADLVGQGKVGQIGLYKVSAAPSVVPTPSIRSAPSRPSTRCGKAMSKSTSCP